MKRLDGKGVSAGAAIGEAYVYEPYCAEVARLAIDARLAHDEHARFVSARACAEAELAAVVDSLILCGERDKSDIFVAHREMLFDSELCAAIKENIFGSLMCAEWAVDDAYNQYIELLSAIPDTTIAERAADLIDVRKRVLRALAGVQEKNLSSLGRDVIVVAHDLLPSDTATLDRAHVLGIITETGGATSHSAIIARSYGIPAVLDVKNAVREIPNGACVALDADGGIVVCEPDVPTAALFAKKAEDWREITRELVKYSALDALTADGVKIEMGLNIGSDTAQETDCRADFVGLFRTEFLYMRSEHLPDEDEQYAAYKRVLESMQGKPVTLRTLDIGGDKSLPYMSLPAEQNPFLGERALRLCLSHPELLRTQLRAALRASVYGTLWIMLPMVGSLDDIRRARAVFDGVCAELAAEGVPFDKNVKFGIMIEIPSMCLIADMAAREVDFASIGSNDLCQYLHAADRMNPEVGEYYQTLSPAMLRALKMAIDAFDRAGKPISLCGELAGDPDAAVLLAGLGLKKLSMSKGRLPFVKKRLADISLPKAREAAQKALTLSTQAEIIELIKSI